MAYSSCINLSITVVCFKIRRAIIQCSKGVVGKSRKLKLKEEWWADALVNVLFVSVEPQA